MRAFKVIPPGCKLAKPDQDGIYRLPLGFNLLGPPCDGGALLVGGLRLPVELRAGPPTALLIRSARLGADAYTRKISASKPAGFEVGRREGRREEVFGHAPPREEGKVFISRGKNNAYMMSTLPGGLTPS